MHWRQRAGRPWRLAFVSVLVLALGCSDSRSPEEPKPAPDFNLATIDGNRVHLADHRGKVVLLDFWATWCPPCRAAIPHMMELQDKYRDEGFVVLGLNLDQNPEDLVGFLSRTTVTYPILKLDDKTRQAYGGVASIPQAFLVDRTGRIRKSYMGYSHEIAEDMEKRIRALLEEAP